MIAQAVIYKTFPQVKRELWRRLLLLTHEGCWLLGLVLATRAGV